MDITLAISERAVAQKRLAENPFDINAMCMLNRAQEQVSLTFMLGILLKRQGIYSMIKHIHKSNK